MCIYDNRLIRYSKAKEMALTYLDNIKEIKLNS